MDALRPRRSGPSRAGTRMARPRFRMSRSMVKAISEAAASVGMTAPAWLRGVVADRLNMTDLADLQPVARYDGTPDGNAMQALRMQLHQTGGLLTQVAKVARKEGEAARHADAESALADVKAAIKVLAGWQSERCEASSRAEGAGK